MRLLCYLSFSLALNNCYREADEEADTMAAAIARRHNRSDRGSSVFYWRTTTEVRNMMLLTVLRTPPDSPLWTMANVRLAPIPVGKLIAGRLRLLKANLGEMGSLDL